MLCQVIYVMLRVVCCAAEFGHFRFSHNRVRCSVSRLSSSHIASVKAHNPPSQQSLFVSAEARHQPAHCSRLSPREYCALSSSTNRRLAVIRSPRQPCGMSVDLKSSVPTGKVCSQCSLVVLNATSECSFCGYCSLSAAQAAEVNQINVITDTNREALKYETIITAAAEEDLQEKYPPCFHYVTKDQLFHSHPSQQVWNGCALELTMHTVFSLHSS